MKERKSNINLLIILWTLVFVGYNLILFVIPNEIMGIKRFSVLGFWISFIIINFMFCCELVMLISIFKHSKNRSEIFKYVPFTYVSIILLIIFSVIHLILMCIPTIPYWISIIVSILSLIIYLIFTILQMIMKKNIDKTEDNVRAKTSFINIMSSKVNELRYVSDDIKIIEIIDELSNEIKYIAISSNCESEEVENNLELIYNLIKDNVNMEDIDELRKNSREFIKTLKLLNLKYKQDK